MMDKKRVYSGDIFLLFFSGSGSSLGSFTSRMPSAILADAFPVSTPSANPMYLRNVEKALSLFQPRKLCLHDVLFAGVDDINIGYPGRELVFNRLLESPEGIPHYLTAKRV